MAKLYFRYGAMNCGKTTSLLQAAYNYKERGMGVLIGKPSVDTKGDVEIVSRIGASRKVDFLVKPKDSVLKIVEPLIEIGVDNYYYVNNERLGAILVDEAQFLNEEQINDLMKLTIMGIPVIAYGLRGDFMTNSFPGSKRLLEIAHSLEEMKTICSCGRKAIFNKRFVNGSPVDDVKGQPQVAIDGQDAEYISMCAICYDFNRLL